MKALIENGIVRDVIPDLEGVPIEERFTPDLAARMVDCPEDVQPGWTYSDGQFTAGGPSLAERKAAAKERVDREAEEMRAALLTPGVGQMATYLEKRREAERLAGDASPDPANYPHLAAELGITPHPATGQVATTLQEMAAIITFTAGVWLQASAAIEHARRGAKFALDQAQDAAGVQAALDALAWPTLPAGA